MFKQILISILAFLLTIFPNSSTLLGNYQELTFPGMHEVSQQIVDAINNNDVEALKLILSDDMKTNNKDLNEKLQFLMDIINDEIIEYRTFDAGGGSTSNYGHFEKSQCWDILFNYRGRKYGIIVSYTIANTKHPSSVGIGTLRLMCDDDTYPDRLVNDLVSMYAIYYS